MAMTRTTGAAQRLMLEIFLRVRGWKSYGRMAVRPILLTVFATSFGISSCALNNEKPMTLQEVSASITQSSDETFHPKITYQNGKNYRADLLCKIGSGGTLLRCRILGENPKGSGVGEFALKLSRRIRIGQTLNNGQPSVGRLLLIPINLHTSANDELK
jgi:hypothetical protein